jgi:WD40 repeat protein
MIAANVNTVINGLDYNPSLELVAYAAANSVLILDPKHTQGKIPKVLFSLRGHQERVNGVQWLTATSLVSISTDKSLIVWSCGAPRDPSSWTQHKSIENAHGQAAINYLRTLALSEEELYVLTMCAGGTLKLWQGRAPSEIAFGGELLFGKNL